MDQHKFLTNVLTEYHKKSKNWRLYEKMRRLGSLETLLILNGVIGSGKKIEYVEKEDYEDMILSKSTELLSTLSYSNDVDILDSQDFYEVMQSYRHLDITEQHKVVETFENIKTWIRKNYEKVSSKNS
jgi:hypothetical protein